MSLSNEAALLLSDLLSVCYILAMEFTGSAMPEHFAASSTRGAIALYIACGSRELTIKNPKKMYPGRSPYGKHVVFTGKLERMVRTDAMQIIVNLGGILDKSVTKETNYLILGNNDYNAILKGEKSSKHKKAERLKLAGQDIEILDEFTFYDLILPTEELKNSSSVIKIVKDWKQGIRDMLQELIEEFELPTGSLYLSDNYSKAEKTMNALNSHTICIWEPTYPAMPGEKPGQNKTVLTIVPSTVLSRPDDLEFSIRETQEGDLHKYLPNDAEILPQTKTDLQTGSVRIRFKKDSLTLIEYIRQNTIYCIKGYTSKATRFGCCSRFMQCSDAKKCVHENKLYSTACMYRSNLEQGHIFYGKNRNID